MLNTYHYEKKYHKYKNKYLSIKTHRGGFPHSGEVSYEIDPHRKIITFKNYDIVMLYYLQTFLFYTRNMLSTSLMRIDLDIVDRRNSVEVVMDKYGRRIEKKKNPEPVSTFGFKFSSILHDSNANLPYISNHKKIENSVVIDTFKLSDSRFKSIMPDPTSGKPKELFICIELDYIGVPMEDIQSIEQHDVLYQYANIFALTGYFTPVGIIFDRNDYGNPISILLFSLTMKAYQSLPDQSVLTWETFDSLSENEKKHGICLDLVRVFESKDIRFK